MKRKRHFSFSYAFLNLNYCASLSQKKRRLFKQGNIHFYWGKVGPISGKEHETRVWDQVTSLVVQNTRALHNKQPSDWEFQKNFRKYHWRNNRKCCRHHYFRLRGLCTLRKGDFSIRLFVVELFALVRYGTSSNSISPFESWPAKSSLKNIRVRNARNTVPMS